VARSHWVERRGRAWLRPSAACVHSSPYLFGGQRARERRGSEKEKEGRKGSKPPVEAGRWQRRRWVMSRAEGERGGGEAEHGAKRLWRGTPAMGSAAVVARRSARARWTATEREKARVEEER
jgi:hypothetical protein